ncbi:MAG: hypothetical protein DMD93_17930 [Candidatus Rokuibacteriota bacterium]|nr:MAG: hypothetical protein DMD93_17930 [Candidatus Rokubacteria bacterium]
MSVFVCGILLLVVPSYGQRSDLSVLEQSIKQLEDADWRNRSTAFYRLLKADSARVEPRRALSDLLRKWPERSDDIKLALVKVLERENALEKEREAVILQKYAKEGPDFPHPFPDAEERMEYYEDLIAAVTSLRDTRSLEALIGALRTGYMVTSTLAGFGDAALDRMIELLNRGDTGTRGSASFVLAHMLDTQNVSRVSDPLSRQKIKDALLRAVRDSSPYVRLESVEGLAKLGDLDVIPLIRNLATGDPSTLIRDAANEALKKLK